MCRVLYPEGLFKSTMGSRDVRDIVFGIIWPDNGESYGRDTRT